MKQIGIFTLTLVLALGIMGTAYGSWSRPLTGVENVSVGTFSPEFGMAVTDDDGTTGNAIDPIDAGVWMGSSWNVNRTDTELDVGLTTAVISSGTNTNDTLTITLGDDTHPTYPGYFATVFCTVVNNGNIPIKVSADAPAISVLTGGGQTTDVGVSVIGVLTGDTPNIVSGGYVSGYITIGIGTDCNGATTNPPVGGGTYRVTIDLTASQFNAP